MQIIDQLKKAIFARYQASTLWTVDGIACYMDHVPNAVPYPFVVFFHRSSNNKVAMPDGTHPTGYDYVMPAIFRFSVYANDRQHAQMEDIADRLEDLFQKVKLTLSAGCTHIGTLAVDDSTTFFDQQQKVWQYSQSFRFWAGK